MRLSKTLSLTMREVPAEAEITSHKLMLRAGLIRKTASGIYNFMPLGLKALKNIEEIVREEMDNAGSNEILASAIIPSELWEESGRWDVMGQEMFRLKDRNAREFCLGPTHEEVFTDLASSEIKSYKQLPLSLYQIQTKYRDERRPRFGLMRSREFVMKDAYSFDKDLEGMDISYNTMKEAYIKIFNRFKLDAKPVLADSGAIGGSDSAEFMVKSEIGEDDIVFCTNCDYAANIEKAVAIPETAIKEELKDKEKVETIGIKTIDEVSKFFNIKKEKIAKTLIYKGGDKIIAVILRGDREVNEVKIANAIGAIEVSMVDDKTVYEVTGAKSGFAGPIDIKVDTILIDEEITLMQNFIVGANETDFHIKNVNYERDFQGIIGDFRNACEGEACPTCGEKITISKGIELGHIFKLGSKYSEAMNATFVDEGGKNKVLQMGCYGIGINRALAAIIEKHNDEDGIIWPYEIAPYKVVIIPAVFKDEIQMIKAAELYERLTDLGIDTVIDDRNERAGVKFKDADLIGYPIRVTVGKKIADGEVEFKLRQNDDIETIKFEEVIAKILELNK